MKNNRSWLPALLVVFMLMSGCSESEGEYKEADFSAVNQVDVQEQPYAFVEVSSMEISELEDPANNEQSTEAVSRALDYIFETFNLNKFTEEELDSVSLLSVVLDSEDNIKVTVLLDYILNEHKIVKIPVEIDSAVQFTEAAAPPSEKELQGALTLWEEQTSKDSEETPEQASAQKLKAVLFMTKGADGYEVVSCEIGSFEES